MPSFQQVSALNDQCSERSTPVYFYEFSRLQINLQQKTAIVTYIILSQYSFGKSGGISKTYYCTVCRNKFQFWSGPDHCAFCEQKYRRNKGEDVPNVLVFLTVWSRLGRTW
jgi:hypothetical protein